jgi:uncharacterized protein involved in exopolysaccharide biosynthesis
VAERDLYIWAEEGPHHVTLRDFLAIGFRQRRLMVTSFIALLGAAVVIVLVLPKQYEAQMKILVRHERADSVVSAERETPRQTQTEVTEGELESEAELLKSKDLLARVVIACNLDKETDFSFWTSSRGKHPSGSTSGQQQDDEKVARAVLALENKLKVEPIKLTNLISVTYRASDPHQAAYVLHTLSNLYLEKHLAMHRVPGAFDFFHQQAEEYRNALEQSEKTLAELGHKEGVVSPTLTREITVRKLSEFEASSLETQAAIEETKRRIQTLQTQLASLPARHTTQVRTADNPQLMERLKSTLLELELKRSELLTKFEPSYRPVQEVEQQIAQTKDAIAAAERAPLRDETTDSDPTYEALRADLAKANTDLAALKVREKATAGMVRSYRVESERLDQQEVLQNDIQRTAKANEENYLLYLHKQEEARIADALDQQRISNVLVAEAASVPFKPLGHRLVFVMLGGLLAALTSVTLAFVKDRLDPSFRTPQEVQDFLGSPVLAALPKGE